ncbi:integral membrane sensor signal transduction histidine kinase [Pseudofrankia inefficax]|uniref:histidine kinase n=1 Tax=Pseudofrankia inefficax (strain DSM 45817 / CECT 9037 / DDB 130130 / EuI1c) TaxID=298654 RepID=E3IZ02_PSEI1|nr:integral membrane sensor signal transduction histidine kinase [Pseudofrankia inefficax]
MPQDAALASALFVVCVLANDPLALVHAMAGRPAGGGSSGPGVVWVWWVAAALTMVGVTLRRRWPMPMFLLCVLAAAARLAAGVPPTVVDLAVPILLATVAARYPRSVSLPVLGGLLLLGTVWLTYGTLTGHSVATVALQVCHRDAASAQSGGAACHHDGAHIWGAPSVLGSVLIAAWAVGAGDRNRRAYLAQLQARAQDLRRERDQRAALAVAAERGRISREVHDVVAHGLALIVVQAQGGEAALDSHPAATRSALRTIVTTGRDSLADMRRVLTAFDDLEHAWHPPPGLTQLPGLLTRVRAAGTPVRLRVEGTATMLPSAVDLSAYRIVQEALTNVVKHAGAGASAEVVVSYRDTEVGIEVSDDGEGTVAGGGNGLRGMRRRVTLLSGDLEAGPGDKGGFVVRAALPVQGRHA